MKAELLKRIYSLEQAAPIKQRFMTQAEAVQLAEEIVALGIDNTPASSLLSGEQIYRMAQEYLTARFGH